MTSPDPKAPKLTAEDYAQAERSARASTIRTTNMLHERNLGRCYLGLAARLEAAERKVAELEAERVLRSTPKAGSNAAPPDHEAARKWIRALWWRAPAHSLEMDEAHNAERCVRELSSKVAAWWPVMQALGRVVGLPAHVVDLLNRVPEELRKP